MGKIRLRKGDEVIVISGKDKGKIGKILRVFPDKDRVIVEGVAVAKRHSKPSQANPQGGIIDKEMPIHVSTVLAYDAKNKKGSRLGFKVAEDGTKTRILRTSGEEF